MNRFYLPPSQSEGAEIFLTGREAHHALHVLRIRIGEKVMVLDGAGTRLLCETRAHDRDKIRLAVLERTRIPRPACEFTLIQALPKGKLIESIIQKATELGVSRVIPLLTERVVADLDRKDKSKKADKWRSIGIEAVKQCGSPWLPAIEPPHTITEVLKSGVNVELPLVAALQDGSRHAREYFASFQNTHGRKPKSVCVWIGPEGDFTPSEYAAIRTAGAQPITLGPLVLRTETAAIYCLSVLNYETSA